MLKKINTRGLKNSLIAIGILAFGYAILPSFSMAFYMFDMTVAGVIKMIFPEPEADDNNEELEIIFSN